MNSSDGEIGVSLRSSKQNSKELYLGSISYIDYSSYKEKDPNYLVSPSVYFYVTYPEKEFVITSDVVTSFRRVFARNLVNGSLANIECFEKEVLHYLEQHMYHKILINLPKV